jgi:NitT/TauT family transport system substrate-binding protein
MLLSIVLACTGNEVSTPGANSPGAEAQLKPVSVALNWYPEPEFGGFYDAVVHGTYAAAGFHVELVPGGPGVPVLEMLAAGKADVAISGADDLLLRRAKGLDAVAIFAGFQDSPVGLMAHAGGPARFEDVTGSVAIEPGSPFQQFLWKRFAWEGKVAMVPTTGTLGAFSKDKTLVQQAYVTSEPCVAEGEGLAVTFLPARAAGWNPYASLAVVRGADRDAEWVGKFREATAAGWAHYLADPSAANAQVVKLNREMPADRMACITERQRSFVTGSDPAVPVGGMTAARWEEIASALRSVGSEVSPEGAWVR